MDYAFDDGTTLGPGDCLVVISFNPADPDNAARVSAFGSAFGIDASVRLVGGWSGRLADGGETVRLMGADQPPPEDPTYWPAVVEDQVGYSSQAPWPSEAAGGGLALERTFADAWGDDAASWQAGLPSPGTTGLGASNTAPTANASSFSTAEDTPYAGGVSGGDDESDPLTFEVVDQPAHGVVVMEADGSFLYSPHENYSGPDSFTFKANDGQADSEPATVSITVTAVNAAPTADELSLSTDEDVAVAAQVSGQDDESDPLTFEVVDQPAHGVVVMEADGSFIYTPAEDYFGPDSFTFKAHDGQADSAAATVSLTVRAVNEAPSFSGAGELWVSRTAGPQVVPGWLTQISPGAANEAGQQVTFTVTVSDPSFFAVQPSLGADGTLVFTPADTAAGRVTLTVTAVDDGGTANGGQDVSAARQATILMTRPLALDRYGRASFSDGDGDKVSVTLVGGGGGVVHFASNAAADMERIVLAGTSERSMLIITGRTSLGGIDCVGPLGRVIAQTVEVSGAVTIGPAGSATATTMLLLGNVADAEIRSAMPISTFLASRWLDTDATADALTAPWAGTIMVRGDLQADVSLTAADARGNSVSVLYVLGSLSGSDVTLAGGAGTVIANSWTAGSFNATRASTVMIRGDMGANLTLSGQNAAGNSLNLLYATGAVTGSAVNLAGSAGTLYAGSWTGGSIRATHVGSLLTTRGAFSAELDLTGANAAGHSLNVLSSAGAVTSASISLAGGAGSILAPTWSAGQFTAQHVGLFMSRGDFTGKLTLTGQNRAGSSLNVFYVLGEMAGGLVRTRGGIGSAVIGSMRNAGLYVCVLDGAAGMPAGGMGAGDYFAAPPAGTQAPAIRMVLISRPAGVFENSVIAAPSMGTVILRGVAPDNASTPFGLAADTKNVPARNTTDRPYGSAVNTTATSPAFTAANSGANLPYGAIAYRISSSDWPCSRWTTRNFAAPLPASNTSTLHTATFLNSSISRGIVSLAIGMSR